MKVQINRNDLHKALGIIAPLTGKGGDGGLLEIYRHVLLEAKDQRLWLTASNTDINLRVNLPARVSQPGAVCLPADTLANFAALLSNEAEIIFSLKPEAVVVIECEGSTAHLKGLPADHFPTWVEQREAEEYTLEASHFKALIESVSMCASKEDGRPALMGVNFNINESGLVLAAADGYRLAIHRSDALFGDPANFTIPAKSMEVVGKVIGKPEHETPLTFSFDGSRLLVEVAGYQVSAYAIYQAYPELTQVIPTSHATSALMHTADLWQAVKLADTFAKDTANAMSFNLDKDQQTIRTHAKSMERGENTSLLNAKVVGEAAEGISLNAVFMVSILKNFSAEKIYMEITNPKSPVVFYPEGYKQLQYVISPMTHH